MAEDKISLTQDIKNKIISPENLIELIDVIYEDYLKSFNKYSQKSSEEKLTEKEPKFSLTLVKPEGESNATGNNQKIKDEKKLYNTKYEGLRVLFNDREAEDEIEFSIQMFSKNMYQNFRPMSYQDYWGNGIRISGRNEEWVRSRYDKINRIITSWRDQCEVFRKFDAWVTISLIIFWSSVVCGAVYLVLNFLKLLEFWLLPVIIGFVIALYLAISTQEKLNELFPSIELLTGPNHLHIEDEKRKRVNWFIISIVIPFIFVIVAFVLTSLFK